MLTRVEGIFFSFESLAAMQKLIPFVVSLVGYLH